MPVRFVVGLEIPLAMSTTSTTRGAGAFSHKRTRSEVPLLSSMILPTTRHASAILPPVLPSAFAAECPSSKSTPPTKLST